MCVAQINILLLIVILYIYCHWPKSVISVFRFSLKEAPTSAWCVVALCRRRLTLHVWGFAPSSQKTNFTELSPGPFRASRGAAPCRHLVDGAAPSRSGSGDAPSSAPEDGTAAVQRPSGGRTRTRRGRAKPRSAVFGAPPEARRGSATQRAGAAAGRGGGRTEAGGRGRSCGGWMRPRGCGNAGRSARRSSPRTARRRRPRRAGGRPVRRGAAGRVP